ncbi:hypothetical protein [Streptomyces sp. NPDC086023]|uniref:hypothetical protein n=1 Tax=Streptomyces sp. NPDC086023 TaxID=3365746 RepID=UPI0037D78446
MYSGWAGGAHVTAEKLDEISGIWTPYTTTWTGSVSNPAIGNGTMEAEYALCGGVCFVRVSVEMGSTTTYGSGQYKWTLPFQAATLATTKLGYIGSAYCTDAGVAYYAGITRAIGGESFMIAISPTTSTGSTPAEWNPVRPFTFASGDAINLFLAYKPA